MTKKILSLGMAVMMLLSLSAAASAAPWDDAVNDGFTNVLLNESVEGIFGTKTLISDPTFETVKSSNWSSAPTPVDAATEGLADAASHGKVVKIEDTKDDTSATNVIATVTADTLANKWIVVQADVYVESIEDDADAFVDIANKTNRIFRIVGGTENVRVGHGTDGTHIKTPEGVTVPLKQWTTVTARFKPCSSPRPTMQAWIGDELVSEDAILNAGAGDGIRLRAKYATAYWDNFQVWTETDVVGSPLAVNSYAAAAKASVADSPVADDNHGKVIAVTATSTSDLAWSDPLIVNPEYVKGTITEKAAADLSLVKVEADIYIPEGSTEGAVAKLCVRDYNGSTEYRITGPAIDSTSTGWHHVVMYVDVHSKKYTSYVDGEIPFTYVDEKMVTYEDMTVGYSSWADCAPASVGLRIEGLEKGKAFYFDNIKLSVPEYKDNAVTTVQTGENSFKLAYKCGTSTNTPAALLIGAVKSGNTLADVDLRASTGLNYETLVVTAKKATAADTISKYLWKDLATLEPLIAAE